MYRSLRSLIICDIVVDVYSNTNLNDDEISRTDEIERIKNGEEGGRKNRPKVRIDGGCYRMNRSLRSLIICDIEIDVLRE